MVNANLIRMYNALGEFEGALNSIGGRQNELIKQNAIMQEWMALKQAREGTAERPQASILDFSPSQGLTSMNQ